MHLAAYTRACTAARDAVAEQYLERTGTSLPDELALGLSLIAVRAFLDEAKGSATAPHEVEFVTASLTGEGDDDARL